MGGLYFVSVVPFHKPFLISTFSFLVLRVCVRLLENVNLHCCMLDFAILFYVPRALSDTLRDQVDAQGMCFTSSQD